VVLTVSDGESAKLTSVADVPRQGRATVGVRLTKLRNGETRLREALVSPTADLWCIVGREDDPARPEAQPQPVPVPITRRDGTGSHTARRILAAGKARW
jgi:hypothetical protein